MMKKLLMLALALVLLTGTAFAATLPAELTTVEEAAFEGDASLTGVLTLPESVTAVDSRAFAATGLHALVVPAGTASVASDVLADGQAAYLMLLGSDTTLPDGEPQGVAYTFGPDGGSASDFFDFYPLESLVEVDGLYYSIDEWEALPLCAADGPSLSGTVTVPKIIGDVPVQTIATLSLRGMSNVTELLVPDYLTIPAGMPATAYEAMTVSAPVADVTEVTAGDPVVFTTEASGMYGEPIYLWVFCNNGQTYSDITSEPTATFCPTEAGELTAHVTVVDTALNDEVTSEESVPVTVAEPQPVYRAVLVGNVYSGSGIQLDGCDTDVAAMRTMLSAMTGTPYQISSYIDLSATGITSAINSAFAGAKACDVSLFHFSGHGRTDGAIAGTGSTFITPAQLRACLDQIPGTKIIIIDACYSGHMIGKSDGGSLASDFTSAFISGFSSFNRDNLASNGYHVMTACSSTQQSKTLYDGRIYFGAFTYGVCYGSGYDEWYQTTLPRWFADSDSNGAITLREAYAYACKRVDYLASMVTMNQSAQYYGDDSFVLWSK